ncbi:MAG: transposase [Rhizobiales bacterium]|nr:transposase [Hyphomicrobiales bacterium]
MAAFGHGNPVGFAKIGCRAPKVQKARGPALGAAPIAECDAARRVPREQKLARTIGLGPGQSGQSRGNGRWRKKRNWKTCSTIR